MPQPRIHIQRDGAYGYLRPLSGLRRWGLFGFDGRLRAELRGTAGEVRREAKGVIDNNPKCFPDRRTR